MTATLDDLTASVNTLSTNTANLLTAVNVQKTYLDSAASASGLAATMKNSYYGTFSTAPTQRPDGTAMQVGDRYYDSSGNAEKVYTGSAWVVPAVDSSMYAAPGGAALVGNNGETVADSLNALQLADYAALRAYAGPRKSVYVTGLGIAGMFVLDAADTTTADNGGTVIVTSGGKRYKRANVSAINVKWFGAKGDRSVDDTPAFTAAITAVGTYGQVYAPTGSYNVSTVAFGNASDITFMGDGAGATRLYATNTGTGAAAVVKFASSSGVRVRVQGMAIIGNALTGTSGNGHGISFVNTAGTGFAPQLVTLRDVHIEGCRGSALDHNGAAMTAAAVYCYLNTAVFIENVSTYSSSVGLYIEGVQKGYVYNHVADTIDNRGIHLVSSENIDFFGGILNNCGAGGATDGGVVRQGCANINFFGTRLKDANPAHDNSRSTTYTNRDTSYFGCDWNQLTTVNTMADIGTGDSGFRIKGGRFKWTSAITAGIGVNVGDGPGGYQMTGLVVEDVACSIGSGGTITALVKVNNTTGVVQAPRFRGLQFGDGSAAGSATTMTNGILLSGLIDSPIIEGPAFHAATNYTITNCVNINATAGNIINPVIIAPVYRTTGGTITNQLANSTGATVTQIASGIASSGNLRASTAAAGIAGTTTIGSTTATTVGAAGAASALPTAPLGYMVGYVGTTQVKVPYYNA